MTWRKTWRLKPGFGQAVHSGSPGMEQGCTCPGLMFAVNLKRCYIVKGVFYGLDSLSGKS